MIVSEVRIQKKIEVKPIFRKLISLSFIHVLSNVLFDLAFFNYFLFEKQIDVKILGYTTTAFSLSLLLGPYLLKGLGKRIGFRKTLLLSTSLSSLLIISQILVSNSILLIILCVLDGVFSGLFWPNLESGLCVLQNSYDSSELSNFSKKFGMSYIFGELFGGMLGFILVFSGISNYFVLIIAILLSFSQILLLKYLKTKKILKFNDNSPLKNSEGYAKKIKTGKKKMNLVYVPLMVALIGEFIFQIANSLTNFLYPIAIFEENLLSYYVYLFTFTKYVLLLMTFIIIGRLNEHKKLRIFLVCMIGLIFTLFSNTLYSTFGSITFTYLLISFFGGIIHAFGAEMLLKHGMNGDSLAKTTQYELFSSIGYGIVPLLVNPDISLYYSMNFLVTTVVIIALFIICINKIRNSKKI